MCEKNCFQMIRPRREHNTSAEAFEVDPKSRTEKLFLVTKHYNVWPHVEALYAGIYLWRLVNYFILALYLGFWRFDEHVKSLFFLPDSV